VDTIVVGLPGWIKMARLAAYVQISECGHFQTTVLGVGGGGDFSRTLASQPGARGTEKAIRAMHAQALAQLEEVRAQALAHYPAAPQVAACA